MSITPNKDFSTGRYGQSSAGRSYYVIRLDSTNDAELTESKRATILNTRKSDHFSEVVEGWKGEASIELKEDVWAEVTITDSNIVQIVSEEAESQAETPEDAASAAESTAESTAESAAESAAESTAP